MKKVIDTQIPSLRGVYFEDIDRLVSDMPDAYLVHKWYFYYFSTLESAQAFEKLN